MDRRLFLGGSVSSVPFLFQDSGLVAQESNPAIVMQTEEGVLVEDVQRAPFKDGPISSADLHSTVDERRRWALQPAGARLDNGFELS